MSTAAPAATGGLPTTLLVGASGVMLTEYATSDPLFIINNSTQLVWIAGDSSVGPGNGVPVEPGTPGVWGTPGQVWAVLDPGATGPATVILSSAIAGWSPSPAAIAAEVVTAQLAAGVPQVFTQTTAYNAGLLAGGISAAIDVHAYASVRISAFPTAGATATINWSDSAGNPCGVDYIGASAVGATPTELPVRGASMAITNNSATTKIFVVTGSNKLIDKARSVNAAEDGDHWTINTTAMVAGTAYPCTQADALARLNGHVHATFTTSNNGVPGRFEMLYGSAASGVQTEVICDTKEMLTANNGILLFRIMMALPVDLYTIQFRCITTSGTNSVHAHFLPV